MAGWLAAGPPLHSPRWIASALYAALVTAAVTWPAWPGYMSYDSLLAYEQSFTGVQDMIWPPVHAYLFWLSRMLGAETWGLFLLQTFLLFFGAGVALNVLSPNRWLALLAQAGFALAFVFFPTMLGSALTHWRDVTTASFGVLAVGLWLAASRARSVALLIVAAAAVGVAVSLRYNAAALFVLMAPLMIAAPFLGDRPSGRVRVVAALSLALFVGLGWASTKWRLPDLEAPPAAQTFAAVQLFDLFGISACSGHNYLPPVITQGATVTVEHIRRAYDPRHLHKTLAERPGLPRFWDSSVHPTVAAAWHEAVRRDFPCYVAHRQAVLMEQMGLVREGVFYPTHGYIEANRFGLELAHPQASEALNAYLTRNADDLWRRPALIYALAALAAMLAIWRRPSSAPFFLALLAGCFAYPALLFIAAPAADARYIFPSNVFGVLAISAAFAVVLAPRRR